MHKPLTWNNVVVVLGPRGYVCSYCSHRVGPSNGWTGHDPRLNQQCPIYVCSFCGSSSFFPADGQQLSGAPFGNSVTDVPTEVGALYVEARKCMTVNSFTSAVLTCRKLLMHIAVEKGATAGKSFMEYVEYLSQKGYIPPDGKGWVDYIR